MSESDKSITGLKSSKETPLSYNQRKLWFLENLQSVRSPFIISRAYHICGPLNVSCLQKAWAVVLKNNNNLRINFREQNGKVFQWINEDVVGRIGFKEYCDLKERVAWEKVRESLEDLFCRPFNLIGDSLFRINLFKISENNFLLALCFHQIIIDRASADLVIQQLSCCYNWLLKTGKFQEKPVEYDYFDFVQYQLKKTEVEKHTQCFWKEQFSIFPEVLNLYYECKNASAHCRRFAFNDFQFENGLYGDLQKFCSENNAEPLHVCAAILYVLLKRYTGQHDICISIPASGREIKEYETVKGPFESLLPVRITMGEDVTFSGVLKEVRDAVTLSFSNQDSFSEYFLDNVAEAPDKTIMPFFQVSIQFDYSSGQKLAIDNCVCRELNEYSICCGCDLNFVLREDNGQLKGKIDYNGVLFSAETISALARHFTIIMQNLLMNPEIRIDAVKLLTEEEMAAIERWNSTEMSYPVHESVPSLFYKQMEQTPDAAAIIQNDREITYRELGEKVEQLERLLIKNGVESGKRVAVCMERSVESVACMLAIFKTGAVYVPLDPKYPSDRLLFIISDADVDIILTKSLYGKILSQSGKRMLLLDKIPGEENHGWQRNLPVILPDSPLYIIYTSGSSGVPKGIVGKNRGLINRLFWIWDTYPFEAGEVCCHKISTGFIDHLAEVFTPLLRGVPIVIFNSENVKGVEDFCNILIDKKISRLMMTPSSLKILMKEKREKGLQFKSIKYVFCSGEALSVSLAEHFFSEFSSARLINIYGSTEVSADVTYYEVSRFSVKDVLHHFSRFSMNKEELQKYKKQLGHFSEYITKPDTDLCDVSKIFTNYRLSETSYSIEQYYSMLYSDVLPFIINTASPRFIGHMTSALPDYLHDLSKLISKLNQNMVKIETSKSLTFLEREALAILHRCFYQFDDHFYEENVQKVNANLGVITTGGTTSNIGALLSARNRLLFNNYDQISSSGESIYRIMHKKGYKDMVIIGSPLMHYSMKKASSILGLGIDNIVYVEMCCNNRINTDDLEKKIRQCRKDKIMILAVVGIAGATETGVIDPLEEIAEITQKYKVHFHVDAAWGGALIFSRKYSHLLKGIEKADSITFCGHKQLYLPQGISVCLFKDPFQLSYVATTATYQASPNSYDFGRFTIEGSRSALSMCLHASLRILGKKGYEVLINDGMEKARFFSEIIMASSAFELIEKPQINIVNYRYIPERFRPAYSNGTLSAEDRKYINDVNCLIQQKQFVKGNSFVSKTTLKRKINDKEEEITVFRAVLSNPLTTCDDLYSVLEDQLKIAESILGDRNDYGRGVINRKIIVKKEVMPHDEIQTIPIGKPIHNTKVYIIDSSGNIAPTGIQGEICIAGEPVAQGYLNNHEQNMRSFIKNPYNKPPYDRLYRTGDLGMYLPDGTIKYLGRIDDQIKIRGIRVECGEVESILCSNSDVTDAAVIGLKSVKGMELIAFYVLRDNVSVSSETLREYLKSKLPQYMIPSIFIEQKRFPVLANGKTDKRRLKQIAAIELGSLARDSA
jgi:putative pyridoxal-dependent aspartate 1-decarboxylase